MKNTSDLKSFNYLENGEVGFSCFDTVKSTNELDAGSYNISYLEYPENRLQLNMNSDSEISRIHNFPDKAKIDALFDSFFNGKVIRKISSLGFYHKTGILLYGKEGTGKSTIIKHYYSEAIKRNNALVFHIIPIESRIRDCWEFITKIRRIQSNPIIVIFEELDSYLKYPGNEGFLKTMIDGNMSINNCLFMATTNYITDIPQALRSRPSRFKYVLNVEGIQNKEDVFGIIKNMIGDLYSDGAMELFADDLTGETMDVIKQFCIDKIMDIKHYPIQSQRARIMGFAR